MVFLLGLIFVWGAQPMMLMGVLMFVVIFYSYYIYLMEMSFWLGYTLMLVVLSGILVVFSYMLSLLPNVEFESSNIFILLALLVLVGGISGDYFNYVNYSNNCVILWFGWMKFMTLFVAGLLLGVMIMVVWLSMSEEGAFREG